MLFFYSGRPPIRQRSWLKIELISLATLRPSSRVAGAVEGGGTAKDLRNLELRGLSRPVAAFNIVQSTGAADARPNLTVVASGPGA
jgi:hypothetical protein